MVGHKGRWVAIGLVFLSIGSLISSLPQFISHKDSVSTISQNLSDPSTCSATTSGLIHCIHP
ncbi:MAG: solute carrier organic anion transporter [Gammaproteobacteria bacterium]|nr:solute carrier organic anion transporter [Gammaproteobacteria bacterium]